MKGAAAGRRELRQVAQVAHGLAVEAQHLRVVQVLVAQRRVAGQHLRQHHHLRGAQQLHLFSNLGRQGPYYCHSSMLPVTKVANKESTTRIRLSSTLQSP